MMEEFARHYQIRFHEPDLLRLALTHRSYLSVTGKGPRESNERLEFLGDSVLGLVTSEFLYRKHPNEHEGQLTKTKSLLVSKAILSRRALAMGLGRFVFMSHSEVESGGRQRLSILADAFESVVGAIYLDQGFEPARKFIHDWLLSEVREIVSDKRHTNYKSHLQEYVQSTFRTHPVYRIRSEIGPDHSKQFMVDVIVGRRVMGSGKGRNKKEAEQSAARDALEKAHHKVTEPVDEAPESPVARTALAERGLDSERTRSRRGRRGGRGRRAPGTADESAPSETEASVEETPSAPPRRAESRRSESRREESPREESRRQESPREESRREESRREESRREPAAPVARQDSRAQAEDVPSAEWQAAAQWERTRRHFEEEDVEEIGRPEGPLEERHVDPYGMERESSETLADPTSAPGFGRTVVGPAHSRRYMGPSEHDREQESDADSESAPAPPDSKRPENAQDDRPQSGQGFGRRPGRSRRGPR